MFSAKWDFKNSLTGDFLGLFWGCNGLRLGSQTTRLHPETLQPKNTAKNRL